MNNLSEIILVSGLPRSGTSLMMKMLEAGGLPLMVDNIREADDDNPKGYYELEEVKQLKDGDVEWLSGAKGKVVKVVAPLLSYLPEEHEYKIVFMRRAMPEILASQKQMLIRRGKDPDSVPDELMAKVFEKQLADVLEWIDGSDNFSMIEVPYSELFTDAAAHIEKIERFLNAELDHDGMAAVVDPDLYRQRENK